MTEDQLEQEALGWLADVGYAQCYGPDIAPDGLAPERTSYRQVLLIERLRQAVARLNPAVLQAARDDAVQQVFEAALTHLPTEPILNFKGWLYILMRNHCLQQLRHKTYTAGEELIEALPYDIGTGTEEAHQLEHTLQQMTEAIELLSEEQRSTITLFYLQRHTYEQIIERTGYTFMQVKSYIQNGRRNLKTILSKKLGNTRP
jgi:RNA polymerase sigma-70 factor (ECF subfamily)